MLRGTGPGPGVRSSHRVKGHAAPTGRPILGALGLCGAAVLGGLAMLALWQTDLTVNVNGDAAGRAIPLPSAAQPDGSACTQARIDRTTGETIVSDCPPGAGGLATLAAWLAERASPH